MKTFLTADSHFSLNDMEGALKRDYRPFETLEEMNDYIIDTWNKQAGKADVIYHLGDFVNYNFKDKESVWKCLEYIKRINAKVILILGNNEERIVEYEFNGDFNKFRDYMKNLGFYDVIENGMYLTLGENRYYLNHYPIRHRDDAINLFGHIHSTCFVKRYGFNVGVDNHYFKLFTQEEIEHLVALRDVFDENVYD